MRQIEWLGMHLIVPDAWQIVRHAVRAEAGHLVWVDTTHQRMQLSWVRCPIPPDLKQALLDYRSRDSLAEGDCRFTDLNADAGWEGYRCAGAANLTRVGRYEPSLERWIELTINWPDGCDVDLEAQVLGSFQVRQPQSGRVRWCAFGIDATTPFGWELVRAQVQPAEASFRFRHGRNEAIILRQAMADELFNGDARRYLAKLLGQKPRLCASRSVHGHTAWAYQDQKIASLAGRGLRGRPGQHDVVWHCPKSRAIFHVRVLSDRWRTVDPAGFAVSCCNGNRSRAAPIEPNTVRAWPQDTSGRVGSATDVRQWLGAVPIHNQAVSTSGGGEDRLDLYVALHRRWYMKRPFSWLLPFREHRVVELDGLGAEVWRACDGKLTCSQVIERFAANHRIGFHEARVSVMHFVHTLEKRRLLVLMATEPARAGGSGP